MITLYSTGCPRCKVLKMKMEAKGIPYEECSDAEKMTSMGFTQVPVLEVDGERMQFPEAVRWVNAYQEDKYR